jgi:hypothetical protein
MNRIEPRLVDLPHPALGQDNHVFTHGTSCPSRHRRTSSKWLVLLSLFAVVPIWFAAKNYVVDQTARYVAGPFASIARPVILSTLENQSFATQAGIISCVLIMGVQGCKEAALQSKLPSQNAAGVK